ncbi:MAG: cation acetate symporter [Burkholderiales bacterium]|nr:cation acetate symporter [Burkholderiales bacterium]
MASSRAERAAFLKQLKGAYTWYTGGFIVFVLVLAVLEQMGLTRQWIGYIFLLGTVGLYAGIGIMSRTSEASEYYVAGRRVPAMFNGMATGADWMSAASFIGMAGTLYLTGYGGLAFILGWTGGYVLVALFLAPYLRKFGQFTIPDFLGERYGGNTARFIGILCAVLCSFVYVVAQIYGVGLITTRLTGVSFELGVFLGLGGILVCSFLGGMKAVTWTQVAQYIILIIAYLVPVVYLSSKVTGVPVPQLMYGQVLEKIAAFEETLKVPLAARHASAFLANDGSVNMTAAINYFALIFCLMLGTASLPHILMRYFTTPSVRQARESVGWSIFFIFLLYFTAPAYAAFAKFEVYQNLIGQQVAQLPGWVASWGKIGLVGACDAANAAAQYALCKGVTGNGDGILQLAEFRLHTDAVVLATPEIAGLPYVISGLVAAGGLAAALSTADGLLLAIANALSHDIYYRMVDPKADTRRRLIVSRVLLLVVAVIAAYVSGTLGADILFLVSWAFSIAASGLFAGLVLGIWWKRTNTAGGLAGLIFGFGACMFFLVTTEFYGPWLKGMLGDAVTIVKIRGRDVAYIWGINNISVGIFGIPAAFLAQIIVTWFTRPAPQAMQDFIDSIRVPAGNVRLVSAEHAVKE